jgi:hypothetical protein
VALLQLAPASNRQTDGTKKIYLSLSLSFLGREILVVWFFLSLSPCFVTFSTIFAVRVLSDGARVINLATDSPPPLSDPAHVDSEEPAKIERKKKGRINPDEEEKKK